MFHSKGNDLHSMQEFTLIFGENAKRFRVTFDSPNGERHTLWLIDNIVELIQRVDEWDNNPPIKGYSIRTIEADTNA